jgi:hypothetical protein
MKFIIFTSIILISLIGINDGQGIKNINTVNQPANLQNKIDAKTMVSQCRPNSDRLCYLTEAIEFILLGDKQNQTTDTLFGPAFDHTTLNEILLLGLQQMALLITDNPQYMPGEIKKNIKQL